MQFKFTIGYLLHELAFLLDMRSDKFLNEKFGVGMAQFKILLVLEERDDVRQRDIADLLCQSQASISRQIKILADLGLIQSRVSTSNRREHIISLTAKGRRTAVQAADYLNARLAPMFETLSEHQRQQLFESLSKLRNTIGD